eukprot:1159235-Pelagomonas_calceolata.AAC.1
MALQRKQAQEAAEARAAASTNSKSNGQGTNGQQHRAPGHRPRIAVPPICSHRCTIMKQPSFATKLQPSLCSHCCAANVKQPCLAWAGSFISSSCSYC